MQDVTIEMRIKSITLNECTFRTMTKRNAFMELKDEFKQFIKIKMICDNEIPNKCCKVLFENGLSCMMNLECEE